MMVAATDEEGACDRCCGACGLTSALKLEPHFLGSIRVFDLFDLSKYHDFLG
jgi:hypothetical protein